MSFLRDSGIQKLERRKLVYFHQRVGNLTYMELGFARLMKNLLDVIIGAMKLSLIAVLKAGGDRFRLEKVC